MVQTQIRQRRTRAQWQALVTAYEASGETLRGFCARHGLAVSTFRHWLGRLEQTAAASPAPPPPSPRARLVPVGVLDDPIAGSGVIVLAGGGVRIEVMPGFDAATLTRVLATLGRGA